MLAVGMPSTAVTMSPALRPASLAGVFSYTSSISAPCSVGWPSSTPMPSYEPLMLVRYFWYSSSVKYWAYGSLSSLTMPRAAAVISASREGAS